MCHFFILEKAPFSGLKLTSVHSRCGFMSFKCSTFFENRSYVGEKASGTSAVTAVIYSGNTQSLNSLARDLLAREPFTKAVITPHAQREQGKVIGCGVHIYMFVDEKKN